MATLIAERDVPPWRRRLYLPSYKVVDAARYAGISAKTILNWESGTRSGAESKKSATGSRERGASLNYLQLVEVAFVAALRNAGVTLKVIKDAREYISRELSAEYPFATHRFKTDGQNILMEYRQFVGGQPREKLVVANKGGQLAWASILGNKFTEFDYQDDLAVRWRPRGKAGRVLIDPKISYGAPTVNGIATWIIRGRYDAGESREDIAADFQVSQGDVEQALQFEGVDSKVWH